ncbi:MAG: 16S rRNA (uracil(1498)-N(3))-methyltransferase [Candidatus Wenzhouxiangella sp. M2_3B_020]
MHLAAPLEPGTELALDERAAHHVVRVLRRRTGDRVVVFDGRGVEAEAEIVAAHRRHGCQVRVIEAAPVSRESPLRVELVQAMAKGEKPDWVVQKATELGVAAIRPVITARGDVRPDDDRRRLARWREIAVNACEQCGRTVLPEVHPVVELPDLEVDASERVMLVPGADIPLGEFELRDCRLAIAVGPEGGFDDADLELLARGDFAAVGLGPRVLRTETAGLAALAIVQTRFGDLGSSRAPASVGT